MISGISQLYFGTSVGKTFAFNDSIYSDDGNNIAIKVRTKNYYPHSEKMTSAVSSTNSANKKGGNLELLVITGTSTVALISIKKVRSKLKNSMC